MDNVKHYLGSKMKYVMDIDDNFLILPKYVAHDSVNMYHIKSAGFVVFYKYENDYSPDNLGAECFGESVSLHVKSQPEHDSDIITRSLMVM